MNSQYDFWAQFIRKGDIVFDVGSYTGDFTDQFLQLEPSLVVAVEPQRAMCHLLMNRFGEDKRVRVFQCALGESRGNGVLYKSNASLSLSSLKPDWLGHNRFQGIQIDDTEKVRVITLDELIETVGLPSLIKIDAEGTDHLILFGLNHKVPVIRFEFVTEYFDNAIAGVNKISQLGDYVFGFLPGESWWKDIEWWEQSPFIEELREKSHISGMWGNIYARLK